MAPQSSSKFTYDLNSIIKNAPPSPGVYSIFSQAERVYTGISDDICAALLELYFGCNPRLDEKDLTHFCIDLVAPDLRAERRKGQTRELAPIGNPGIESPDSGRR